MKRALSAAVVGGLMIFAVPQAAFADHEPGHHGSECTQNEQSAGPGADCAGQPEGSPAPDDHGAPEGSGRHDNHDGDDGTILF